MNPEPFTADTKLFTPNLKPLNLNHMH